MYKKLLKDIKEEEQLENIQDLNMKKTDGLLKITYEIIKKSNNKMKELLRKFFNKCIKLKLMSISQKV